MRLCAGSRREVARINPEMFRCVPWISGRNGNIQCASCRTLCMSENCAQGDRSRHGPTFCWRHSRKFWLFSSLRNIQHKMVPEVACHPVHTESVKTQNQPIFIYPWKSDMDAKLTSSLLVVQRNVPHLHSWFRSDVDIGLNIW